MAQHNFWDTLVVCQRAVKTGHHRALENRPEVPTGSDEGSSQNRPEVPTGSGESEASKPARTAN